MKLFKHYFDKSDTPFIQGYQRERKYHTVWTKGMHKIFYPHKVIKIKFLGIFTVYKLTDKNRAKIENIIEETKIEEAQIYAKDFI